VEQRDSNGKTAGWISACPWLETGPAGRLPAFAAWLALVVIVSRASIQRELLQSQSAGLYPQAVAQTKSSSAVLVLDW